jgi:tetratricopeptide (TPR) repeat protein
VKPGRNEPCPCGSGKKFKRCCGQEVVHRGAVPAELAPAEVARLASMANAGRLPEVEARARELLVGLPHSGMAWRFLGLALWMQGKDAFHALQKTAELCPRDAEAHSNLGSAWHARGQVTEAVACYRRALELNPDFADAHNNLGSALRDLGLLDDAVASYRRALVLKPDAAVSHCNLGHALRTLGQVEEAAQCYRRAVEIQPDFSEAHTGLAHSLKDLGQLEQAVMTYHCSISLKADDPEVHHSLGSVYFILRLLPQAEASCRRAIALDPLFAEAHNTLGMALRLQGRATESQASSERALEIDPHFADALNCLSQLKSDSGDFAAAEALLTQAIAIEPDSTDAWAGIARLRKMSRSDTLWLEAAQALAQTPLPPRREANLRYSIGKYFDDVGEFEQAFANYQRANELSKLEGRHDRSAEKSEVDGIIEFYDRRWVTRPWGTANASSRPVFIVGMPRSGTTLAEQILAAHPLVFGAGELSYWDSAAAHYRATRPGDEIAAGIIGEVAANYLTLLEDHSPDAKRVVDKLPANYKSLGLIHAALPNARVIHMRRNPIDTCLSIYFQDFNVGHTYANDLEDLAHFYAEYLRVMEHWRATLPPQYLLEVPYEQLTQDPEGWSRKMIDFIGLPWDPACLDFDRLDRKILTFSKWQARQKIHRSSVERWRRYEKFVEPLLHLAKPLEPS